MRGETGKRPEVFLSHFPHRHATSYFTTYRDGDWKLVYRYFPDADKGEKRYALYHLRNDLSESKDVSQDHPDQVKRLTQSMISNLEEMGALYPVVDGKEQPPVPAP